MQAPSPTVQFAPAALISGTAITCESNKKTPQPSVEYVNTIWSAMLTKY